MTAKNIRFWDKVEKCNHKNIYPDYNRYVPCSTPLCSGYEEHCMDCGVYIVKCSCGFSYGLYGWPYRRRINDS